MAMTNALRNYLASWMVGDSVTAFDSDNAYIGVGDSTSAFGATQTDLQAVTNKLRKGMDATYPQRTDNVMTFRSTFDSAEANYTWNEWGVFNHTSAGTMANRKVEVNGTKLSGQTWIFEVELTISIGT